MAATLRDGQADFSREHFELGVGDGPALVLLGRDEAKHATFVIEELTSEAEHAMLEKHVGKIALRPKWDGPRPFLMASGRLDFGCVTGRGVPVRLAVVSGCGGLQLVVAYDSGALRAEGGLEGMRPENPAAPEVGGPSAVEGLLKDACRTLRKAPSQQGGRSPRCG